MQDTGCKKLIMAGIVLDVCVVFPALAALAEGYEVRQCIESTVMHLFAVNMTYKEHNMQY